jgi:hypothetical protein
MIVTEGLIHYGTVLFFFLP